MRAAQKIERAAHGADIHSARDFGVDLAGQIHLDRQVERDETLDPRQHPGIVSISGGAELHRGVAMAKLLNALAAEHHAGHRDAAVDALSRVGDDLSLIHISEPTRLGMISYAVFCLKK